ncbi:hypothetical protein ACP70R_007942 [Stipagrostis hirtigluma subsp. patula]
MDELILDNICDRLRPLVFSSGEKVIREGDPVQRMVFMLQGKLRSTQPLTKGDVHAGRRELPWRRAAVVVPAPAVRGPAAGVVGDVLVRGGGAGVLPRRTGPALHHGALPL